MRALVAETGPGASRADALVREPRRTRSGGKLHVRMSHATRTALATLLVATACSCDRGSSPPGPTRSTVTVVTVGGGIVTSMPPGIACGRGETCSMEVDDGTTVTLSSADDAGFGFTGWSGACTGAGPCVLTVASDVAVTATFIPVQLLRVLVNGGGSVTSAPAGISCTGARPCAALFATGTLVTLTAAPNAAWAFSGWSGACTGTGACTVTIDASATVTASFESTSATAVTFQGRVTYDFVPATYSPATRTGTLNFAAATAKPVRGAAVRVVNGTSVLATATTSSSGDYTLTFEPGGATQVRLEALARTFDPSIQVEDNTDANAIWAVGVDSAATSRILDLHAPHGWTGTAYGPNRISAPFAILDSMYTAGRRIIDIPRAVWFPALKVNWSPDNRPEDGNKAAGQIGTSHYSPAESEIYILGLAGVDTDEFDSHVIVHEWGHYFEDNLSRADSPGGGHGPGDLLDPRLAFGEGYGNAIAAMLLPESIYADTLWSGATIGAFGFDAETTSDPTDDPSPGPFSEMSVLRALYDLYDPVNDDGIALGLAPIYDALVGPQRTTDSLTTIASFVTALKNAGGNAAGIDAVLASRGIGPIATQFGDGDTKLRAMFEPLPVGSSRTVSLDGHFEPNKQPQVRYFVVQPSGGSIRVTSASSRDVDIEVYRNGVLLAQGIGATGAENVVAATQPGANHVVVLTGWGQLNGTYSATVTVSQP